MNTQIFRLLIRLLAFSVVGGAIYSILIGIWGNYLPEKYSKNLNYNLSNSYIRFQEVKVFENIDILFAGSSHSIRGFDPRIFEKAGYSSFNIGSKSQTPFQTKYLLEQYIDELHPKLLIMEVYPALFASDGVESSLDIISNNNDINDLPFVFQHKNSRVLNTFIYSIFRNVFHTMPEESEIKLYDDTYVGNGYIEKKLSFNKTKEYKREELVYFDFQFDSLEEIDRISKERGIVPIYVVAPIPKKRYNSFVNLGEFEERMGNFGIFYDFNKLMKLNDTLHFFDSHHLNQNGVELFNHELIKILSSLE